MRKVSFLLMILVFMLLQTVSMTGILAAPNYNYVDAFAKSILFYEANKCGPDADNNRFAWRGPCHTQDGADLGIDLNGGFHDAGDHVNPTRRTTPTPTTRTATPTPTMGTGGYVVAYVISSDWGVGATINVTITNNSATAVNGWTLAFTFPGNQTITNLWNGVYTQTGASMSVRDAGSNANIPANGGSVNFGFNISYSGVNAKPASFTLNGTACQVQ